MTRTEIERIAVLESSIGDVQADVTEIKGDVKSLVATQATLAVALAVKNAAEEQQRADRMSTGRWLRTYVGWFFALIMAVVAVANFLHL